MPLYCGSSRQLYPQQPTIRVSRAATNITSPTDRSASNTSANCSMCKQYKLHWVGQQTTNEPARQPESIVIGNMQSLCSRSSQPPVETKLRHTLACSSPAGAGHRQPYRSSETAGPQRLQQRHHDRSAQNQHCPTVNIPLTGATSSLAGLGLNIQAPPGTPACPLQNANLCRVGAPTETLVGSN